MVNIPFSHGSRPMGPVMTVMSNAGTSHDRLQSFSDSIFLLGTGGQHVTSEAKAAIFSRRNLLNWLVEVILVGGWTHQLI